MEDTPKYEGYTGFSKKSNGNEPLKNRNFSFSVSQDEYRKACVVLERRVGSLRKITLMMALIALVMIITVDSLRDFVSSQGGSFIPFIVLTLILTLLVVFTFFIEPKIVKANADKEYPVHRDILYPTEINLEKDELKIKTPYLETVESYANMLCCVEMNEMFILIKDEERLCIIPKRELDNEQIASVSKFLSVTFARRHYRMKNWVF